MLVHRLLSLIVKFSFELFRGSQFFKEMGDDIHNNVG